MLVCCVFVCSCGGCWLDRDAVDDDLAELVLRHVFVVVHGADEVADVAQLRLRHPHEACRHRHPRINFLFIFEKFFNLNKQYKKQ